MYNNEKKPNITTKVNNNNDNQKFVNYVKEDRTFQYIAATSASLATLSTGAVLGWPSQIASDLLDGQLDFPMNEDELGWVCSATSLGAAFLSLFIGGICDRIGRKITMLSMIILLELGWCLIIFSNSLWMLTLGRFVTGMIAGSFCVTVPLYIDEIAQKEIRGTVGCFTQLMISIGILFSNVLSNFVNIRHFSAACAFLPIIFGVCFVFMPETPIFLLKKDKVTAAYDSLAKLRSKTDVSEEFERMKKTVHSEVNYDILTTIKKVFGEKPTRKASVIAAGITIFKVFCGIDAITSYLAHIFEQTHTKIQPQIGTIIFSTAQIVAVIFQTLVIDNWGRRILLILSESIMALCLFSTGISLYLKDHILDSSSEEIINYIPLISLSLFNIAFCLGIGPIGWSLCAEIFPNEFKGRALSVCTFSVWFLAFLNVKSYMSIEIQWHSYVAFFIYSVASLLGTLFVLLFVPETKNKTYQEIEKELSM